MCECTSYYMRVDAPSFRSVYTWLFQLWLYAKKHRESWRLVPLPSQFGGKIYSWRVGREKRNLQGHLGVYVDHSWGGLRACNQLLPDFTAALKAPNRGSQKTPNTQFFLIHSPLSTNTILRTSNKHYWFLGETCWQFLKVWNILNRSFSGFEMFEKYGGCFYKRKSSMAPNTEILLRLTRLGAMGGSWASHIFNRNDLWMCWKSRLWWAQHTSHFAGNQLLRSSPLLAESRLKIHWISDAVRYQKDTYCRQSILDSLKIKS
jgi:hypothetical protein